MCMFLKIPEKGRRRSQRHTLHSAEPGSAGCLTPSIPRLDVPEEKCCGHVCSAPRQPLCQWGPAAGAAPGRALLSHSTAAVPGDPLHLRAARCQAARLALTFEILLRHEWDFSHAQYTFYSQACFLYQRVL